MRSARDSESESERKIFFDDRAIDVAESEGAIVLALGGREGVNNVPAGAVERRQRGRSHESGHQTSSTSIVVEQGQRKVEPGE